MSKLQIVFVFYQVVISPGLIEKMEATIEAELVVEDEGKIYTAADLFRLPVRSINKEYPKVPIST